MSGIFGGAPDPEPVKREAQKPKRQAQDTLLGTGKKRRGTVLAGGDNDPFAGLGTEDQTSLLGA